jgi:glycosyltransferase involved in cell wall biosynthesis
VLKQTSTEWELIIVDDGSTDNTYSVIEKYLSDKVKYLHQQNSGANTARNLGAKNSACSYLTFLDSDDELYPEWVESFQLCIGNKPSIICCGTYRIEPEKEYEVMPKSMGKIFGGAIGKFTNGASYAINKDLFFEIGGFDDALPSGQHTELSFRLANKIVSNEVKIVNIFRPLVKIHIHEGPRIRTNSESKFMGAFHILGKHSVLLARDPALKRNYAKILTVQGFRKRYFGTALKSFIIFCKYSILAKFG